MGYRRCYNAWVSFCVMKQRVILYAAWQNMDTGSKEDEVSHHPSHISGRPHTL